jgi:hypothetical protein
LKEKQIFHEKATDGRHFLFFEHDLEVACGNIVKNEQGRVVFGGKVDLADLV